MFAERIAEEGILLHVGSAFPSPQDPLGSPQPPSQLCPGERSPAGIQGKRTSQRTHGGLAEQEAGVSDVGRGGLQLGGHIHHIGEEPVEAELHLCPAGEGHHFAQRLWKGKPRGISSLEGPADTFLQTSVPEACGDPQPSPPPPTGSPPRALHAYHSHVPSARQLLPRDRLGLSGTGLPSEYV